MLSTELKPTIEPRMAPGEQLPAMRRDLRQAESVISRKLNPFVRELLRDVMEEIAQPEVGTSE